MKLSTVKVRASTKEIAQWKRLARATHLSLSAWIRKRCNPPKFDINETTALLAHRIIEQLKKEMRNRTGRKVC